MKYTPKIGVGCPIDASERVLTQWWWLVAFMKALDLLHQGMRVV
jgi:hypothetical protein